MEQYEFTGTNPISPHLVSRKAGVQCVLKSDVVEHTIDGTKYNLKEILDADIKGDKVTVKIGDEEKSVQEILKDGIPETSVNKKYLKENYVERTEFDDKFENAVTTGDLELQNYITIDDVMKCNFATNSSFLTTVISTDRNDLYMMTSLEFEFVKGYRYTISKQSNSMYQTRICEIDINFNDRNTLSSSTHNGYVSDSHTKYIFILRKNL